MSRRAVACAVLATAFAATAAIGAPHRAPTKAGLVDFETTPFPYAGTLPDSDRPFLDAVEGDRLGHTSPRGGVHWQDATYASKQVLLAVSPGFDPRKPVVLVVFFHGNGAKLDRDVWHRQQVVEQVTQAHLNAVLVAPQFAVDAQDSSAGRFWTPGVFAKFLAEAASRLAAFDGDPQLAETFDRAPVLLVAYSGGYNPAAFVLTSGGANDRVCGVILLDALFGETNRFVAWIVHRGDAFFVSAYSKASEDQNLALQTTLKNRGLGFRAGLDNHTPIDATGIAFVPATGAVHNDFVTEAWTALPLKSLLSRVSGCRSKPAHPLGRQSDPAPSGGFFGGLGTPSFEPPSPMGPASTFEPSPVLGAPHDRGKAAQP